MHPAYSVIFFTTSSGAGYGLLVWLSLWRISGTDGASTLAGLTMLAIALVLITAGLLSSTAHLGHPERAWRAFSQWRSSWLSREGVAAVATYVPACLMGLDWLFNAQSGALSILLALLAIGGAGFTVWCTGMIYASLRAIPQWNLPVVAPAYIVLALATGGLLFVTLLLAFGYGGRLAAGATLAALVIAALAKLVYWRSIDGLAPGYGSAEALGLARGAKPRPLDGPHTQPNFVQREMGYEVARKHANKLRRIAGGLLFAAPFLCLVVVLAAPAGLALAAGIVAIISAGAGVLVERWLFFAEARHVSMLYYGAEKV